MQIVIKNLDKTSLDEQAFIALVKKYAANLKHDIRITFDSRVKKYHGYWIFDHEKKVHSITISLTKSLFPKQKRRDKAVSKFEFIATTVHELRHAQQFEELGSQKFWSDSYGKAKGPKTESVAEFFSDCELDARIYEWKNFKKAVKYYDSCIAESDVL